MSYNYAYLIEKYFKNACYTIEDRTYEGLVWHGPGEKPSEKLFASFAEEEDRQTRMEANKATSLDDLMKERQHQYRAEALEKARPFEEKLKEAYDEIIQEIHAQRLEAVEVQKTIEAQAAFSESWLEISKAQEKINQASKDFLASTDWYVTREQETKITVPEEIALQRAQARESIQAGSVAYAKWQELREKERPSREELRAAILAGGEELARIKTACQAVHAKYAKPKRKL